MSKTPLTWYHGRRSTMTGRRGLDKFGLKPLDSIGLVIPALARGLHEADGSPDSESIATASVGSRSAVFPLTRR